MWRNESSYPAERQVVHIFPSAYGTARVVNYAADHNSLNSFLSMFDIWEGNGEFMLSDDGKYNEVWFEVSQEFHEFAMTETMGRVFKRFGVRVEFG